MRCTVQSGFHEFAVSEAKALLRGEMPEHVSTSEIVRNLWFEVFDKSMSQRQRNESNDVIRGIFDSISRKDTIAQLPAWYGDERTKDELEETRKKMDSVKHMIGDGTLIVPVMVSGFIYGAHAYRLARERHGSARFSLVGYSANRTNSMTPKWYPNRLWIDKSDVQRIASAKNVLIIDDVIESGETIGAVSCGIAEILGGDMSKVKSFSPLLS